MSAVDTVALLANTSATDAELVEAVRAGEDEAFEELFRRYQGRVCAFVVRRVHDHGRAEDLTQDVFLSALRHLRATSSEITFKPWLFEIARNATIDLHRRSSRTEEVPVHRMELVGADPPEIEVLTRERLADLQGAFDELNEVHHRALVMRELEGRSYREIGERLTLTQPAVESVLFRARRRLAKEYRALRSRAAAFLPIPLVLRRGGGAARDASAGGPSSNFFLGFGGHATTLAEQAAALVTAAALACFGGAVLDERSTDDGRDARPAAAPGAAGMGEARPDPRQLRPHGAPAMRFDRPARGADRRSGRSKFSPGAKRMAPEKQPPPGAPPADVGSDQLPAAPNLPQVEGLGVAQPAAEGSAPPDARSAPPPLALAAPQLPRVEPQSGVNPLIEALKGHAQAG
jgi:RNA polymerase sigma factor (sigma-70 family)